jgi:NAD(P)-dependent dehydrogenase (short-subunit alcohol dehydrogenase family)
VPHNTTIALVTGANKGIGRAIAQRHAGTGMTLIAAQDGRCGGDAAALRAVGGDVHLVVLVVTAPATIEARPPQVADQFGRLDVLVDDAGTSEGLGGHGLQTLGGRRPRRGPGGVRGQRPRCHHGHRRVAAAAAVIISRPHRRRLQRHLIAAQHDRSRARHVQAASRSRVPVSKAALNALTVQYAKAVASDHILVNAVAPGGCAADFTKGVPTRHPHRRSGRRKSRSAWPPWAPTAAPAASSGTTARCRGNSPRI